MCSTVVYGFNQLLRVHFFLLYYFVTGLDRSLEDEVTRLKEEIDVTSERLDAAEKDAADLIAEVEELRLKLQAVEEEKTEALNNDQLASSEIAALTEQKNELAKELEASKDEVEKVKKAMEGLASALHEMSAESREAQEKYLIKQEEIEHARAQVEELNNSLQNAKESYEVMLDEVNYEKVCLKKSVERMEAEAKNVSEEWQSKELSFVNSIRKSEEEIDPIKIFNMCCLSDFNHFCVGVCLSNRTSVFRKFGDKTSKICSYVLFFPCIIGCAACGFLLFDPEACQIIHLYSY